MKKMSSLVVVATGALLLTSCGTRADDAPQATIQSQQEVHSMNPSHEIKKTASGLEYKVLHASGSGTKATCGQKVEVHYTGWLETGNFEKGTKFDSSVDRGQKFDFNVGLGYVIKGWDEALQLMEVGDKYLLRIPAELGYGSRGAGNVIPPNATLLFEVELFDVK